MHPPWTELYTLRFCSSGRSRQTAGPLSIFAGRPPHVRPSPCPPGREGNDTGLGPHGRPTRPPRPRPAIHPERRTNDPAYSASYLTSRRSAPTRMRLGPVGFVTRRPPGQHRTLLVGQHHRSELGTWYQASLPSNSELTTKPGDPRRGRDKAFPSRVRFYLGDLSLKIADRAGLSGTAFLPDKGTNLGAPSQIGHIPLEARSPSRALQNPQPDAPDTRPRINEPDSAALPWATRTRSSHWPW